MNRYIIISSVVAMLSIGARCQDSTGISFQSLVKSTTVNTANTTIGVRLSVLQNSATGPVVYAERQTPMSDQFGMITLEIGAGTAESGVFGEIDWGSGRHFIKSEIDPSGGANYSISGTFEQLSVCASGWKGSEIGKCGKFKCKNIRHWGYIVFGHW